MNLYYCDVDRGCPEAYRDELAGDWATSHDNVHDDFVNNKSNPMLVCILFSTEQTLCPSSVAVLAKFFYLISQSPRVFYLYLTISCVSSWSFPAALSYS